MTLFLCLFWGLEFVLKAKALYDALNQANELTCDHGIINNAVGVYREIKACEYQKFLTGLKKYVTHENEVINGSSVSLGKPSTHSIVARATSYRVL